MPAIVVDRVLAYTGKIQLRKKPEFVSLICRYWSLKREARRGAPLLKRLHLEPWTASNAGQAQTEEERVAKLEQLTALKGDLEKVRELAALTCKREARKLQQATALRDLLAAVLFYNGGPLRAAFEKVTRYALGVLARRQRFDPLLSATTSRITSASRSPNKRHPTTLTS